MATFDAWLRGLRVAGKGPVTLPAATRGLSWSCPIRLAGDWTGATLTGAIRLMPDAGGAALASFTMSSPTVGGGVTAWIAQLGASGGNSTASLPTDDDFDGLVELAFAFIFTPSGGVAELLFGGVFPLLGKV